MASGLLTTSGAAFLRKLHASPKLRSLLSLVGALYGSVSRFVWTDDGGREHVIEQGEGEEQGCPLMPALYALAQHDALVEATAKLQAGEKVLSFLDDLYVVPTRARAVEAFKVVSGCVQERAGVNANVGKLRVWCRSGGAAPEGFGEASGSVWVADKSEVESGVVVPGSPIGHRGFVEAWFDERIAKERRLWEELPKLRDTQTAWVLWSGSAALRASHVLRPVPPSQIVSYVEQHDEGLWSAFCKYSEQLR